MSNTDIGYQRIIDEQEAEIEKLREALEKIKTGVGSTLVVLDSGELRVINPSKIAREALKEAGE